MNERQFTPAPPTKPPTPLDIFNWAVTRQSLMGPGVNTCAEAFNISAKQVRELVANWNDTRGHMECVRAQDSYWRIDAYYNAG